MNFYFEAGKILDKIDAKHGSIKGILATVDLSSRKRMTAAVIRTLEYKPVLLEIIQAAALLKNEKKLLTSTNLALVLVHDLLFSKGIEAGDGPIKQAILRHKTRLHSELVKIKIKKGVKENKDLARSEQSYVATIPRYVRVNRNAATLEEAKATLIASRKLKLVKYGEEMNDSASFSVDEHIPDLLALHPSIALQSDDGYLSGVFILQDKASCLPAAILAPPRSKHTVAIDATAAPGNKTSHLSALMGNIGTIYALERDKRRFKTLEKMLAKAQCKNVQANCGDFLETNPLDARFAQVTHILLDPSCSGSGIVNRLDHLAESEHEEQDAQSERLQKLSDFQLAMIQHAMRYPKMQKIVYSTCSIHAQENEHVVKAALKTEEATSFRLAPRSQVLPKWHRRGIAEEMDGDAGAADSLIRTNPEEDRTNGFFVAAFVRIGGTYDEAEDATSATTSKRKLDEDDVKISDDPKSAKPKKKKRKKTSAAAPSVVT